MGETWVVCVCIGAEERIQTSLGCHLSFQTITVLDSVLHLQGGREIDLITCHIIQHKKNSGRKSTLVFLVGRKIL